MEAVTAMKPLIKVAAISGSLRKGSFNTGLLRAGLFLFFNTLVLNTWGFRLLITFGIFIISDGVDERIGSGVADWAYRHLSVAVDQHRSGIQRDLPSRRRSFPAEDTWSRQHSIRFPRVQFLCLRLPFSFFAIKIVSLVWGFYLLSSVYQRFE